MRLIRLKSNIRIKLLGKKIVLNICIIWADLKFISRILFIGEIEFFLIDSEVEF